MRSAAPGLDGLPIDRGESSVPRTSEKNSTGRLLGGMRMLWAFARCWLAAITLGLAIEASAQDKAVSDFPSRGARIIVPFAAGSVLDTQARIIAEGLGQRWAQPVIVENVAGSGGNAGTERFARSSPDGYTLLAAPPGPFTINRLLYKSVGYDADKFVPITLISTVPNVLVVRNDLPIRTLGEYLARASSIPGQMSYASQGAGTTPFLIVKRLEVLTNITMVHVPYRGSALALADVAAGHVDSFFDAIGNVLGLAREGKVRAIAITDTVRSPLLPDVATVSETVPGFRALSWFALAAPPGTPAPIANRLSADTQALISSPAINKRLVEIGLNPVGGSREETAKFIAEENEIWSKLVESAGLTLD
jgi:tripartite-type tricarboxylate transporter receptor subunit TctC